MRFKDIFFKFNGRTKLNIIYKDKVIYFKNVIDFDDIDLCFMLNKKIKDHTLDAVFDGSDIFISMEVTDG